MAVCSNRCCSVLCLRYALWAVVVCVCVYVGGWLGVGRWVDVINWATEGWCAVYVLSVVVIVLVLCPCDCKLVV